VAELVVDLVGADRTIWTGSAESVSAPAADGGIGILPGHSPLLAILREGTVTIVPVGGRAVRFDVLGGFISVDADRVTIVADESPITNARGAGSPRSSSQ
jgi:F-type H+-transporting ATPase subunit epsilon